MYRIKVDYLKWINTLVLIDLVFGGSGRVVMVGPVSFRTTLFGIAMICTLVYYFAHGVRIDGVLFFLIALLVIYLTFNVAFIGSAALGTRLDFYIRYIYVFLVFFYEAHFRRPNLYSIIEKMRVAFETLTLLFAVFTILLWTYALMLGGSAYNIIELAFFRPYVYGSFSWIGSGIPRIFMKSSIFVPIGLLFYADRYIDAPSFRNLGKCIICAVATITTFTSGLFLATAICGLLLLHRRKVMSRKVGVLVVVLLIAAMTIGIKSGLLDIMSSRYTDDYSTSYRLIQFRSLLNEAMLKPIVGHGFGHEFVTVYGNTIRKTADFEVAWGELLVDAGIIGFLLFVAVVLNVLFGLRKGSRNNNTIYLFALGLLLICIESLTNPFINNSIGLTYFAICAGIKVSIKGRTVDVVSSGITT